MGRISLILVIWLEVSIPLSLAQVSSPPPATFHTSLPQIEAYVLMYQDFFEGVELESEKNKGITYLDESPRKTYESAEEYFSRPRPMYVYDKTPDSGIEWLALAVYYMGDYRYVNNYPKAEEAVKKAMTFNLDGFEAYALLFYLYDRNRVKGEPSLALGKLETLAKTPQHFGVLGSIYMPHKTNPVGNWSKSEYYFNKALEGNPDYALAYEEMAWYYYYVAKDNPMAVHYMKKYLELRPEDPVAKEALQTYSSVYPPVNKRDPFVLVMAGIGVLFALNLIRIAWNWRKSGKAG